MYNRYDGNSGRMTRLPDGEEAPRRPPPPPPASPPPPGPPGPHRPGPSGPHRPGPPPGGPLSGFLSGLPELNSLLAALDNSDLLLMLVLYLLYRESGDEEFLYILAGLFLL